MDMFDFETTEQGAKYRLPKYRVVVDKGLERTGDYSEVAFVRGSVQPKAAVEHRDGVLHETLLKMIIADLEFKSTLVQSDQAERMLLHLRIALDVMNARTYRRQLGGVLGSYKK